MSQSEEATARFKEADVFVNSFTRDIGHIIVAEDQAINVAVLRNSFKELDLDKNCSYCINGQQTIDLATILIHREIEIAFKCGNRSVNPIDIMLLDYRMPGKDGDQVV